MRRELLIGCGSNREKKLGLIGLSEWENLTTLDFNEDHKPDVVHDLETLPYPFEDNAFDECHAYEVLEHTGRQGDWRFFFAQWTEFWRILKPNGLFFATVPLWNSPWAWGDPSHSRVIPKESLIFLDQRNYEMVGISPITDFRFVWKGNFETVGLEETEHHLRFVLKAIK